MSGCSWQVVIIIKVVKRQTLAQNVGEANKRILVSTTICNGERHCMMLWIKSFFSDRSSCLGGEGKTLKWVALAVNRQGKPWYFFPQTTSSFRRSRELCIAVFPLNVSARLDFTSFWYQVLCFPLQTETPQCRQDS